METNIILGPPGTGKTTVLMDIIEEELTKVEPTEIAYVSFTRVGAYEGKDRAMEKFEYSQDDFPYFKTLHSIAFKEAGIKRKNMIGKRDYKILGEALNMKFTGHYTEEFYHSDDRYLFFNDMRRNNPRLADQLVDALDMDLIKYVTNNYKAFKDYFQKMDFSDLIETFIAHGNPLPVKVAIIDEAQDLTTLQWKMALVAFRNCERVYIAGDDDQAIYEWSGADVRFFLGLRGNVRILDHSWRLPRVIQDYAQKITDEIVVRANKLFTPAHDNGWIVFVNSLEEIDDYKDESWMLLSRNNKYLKQYEEWLRAKPVNYLYKGKAAVNPRAVQAINVFERARKRKGFRTEDLEILSSFMDIEGEIDFSRPWFEHFWMTEEDKAYYRDLIKSKTHLENPRYKINTIHTVKGAEADNVVLMLDVTRNVYRNFDIDNDAEMRCYYVAVTRAKKRLYIVHTNTKYGYPVL